MTLFDGKERNKNIVFHLFQWKTLCKNSFSNFLIFSNIRKNELKKNYFWSTEKILLIFKDCFFQIKKKKQKKKQQQQQQFYLTAS